jgi:hypothetical protein
MQRITDYPPLVFVVAIVAQWLCAWLGAIAFGQYTSAGHEAREDFKMVLAASLTLLGLIIGFSFSMAVSRYDLRKSYEEAEANAIGTAYVRADLLPAADGARLRALLSQYLELRIEFYNTRDREHLQLNAQTTQTQRQLWSTVQGAANAQPSALTALAAAAMNDVLNAQGYTQAAWWNRIPRAAWALMVLIALLCNLMLGYAAGRLKVRTVLAILPLVVSVAFFLIADIDSPRSGVIHVTPQNLLSLAETLHR